MNHSHEIKPPTVAPTAGVPWLATYDGGSFEPLSPDPAAIDPATIARVLARVCRYAGHVACDFYSVAEHSVRVMRAVRDREPLRPDLHLAALLHDAAEAYSGFGDVAQPVKRLAPIVVELERAIGAAVAQRFDLAAELLEHELVHWGDLTLLATEKRDLLPACPRPWKRPLPPALPERIRPWEINVAEFAMVEELKDCQARFERYKQKQVEQGRRKR